MYQKAYGGYFTRVLVMMLTTLMFFGVIGWFQLDLLRKDGQLFNWRSWKHGLGTLFGLRKGFFTRLLLPYLDYYRPGFHPSDHDTAKLEKYWKDKLAFAD